MLLLSLQLDFFCTFLGLRQTQSLDLDLIPSPYFVKVCSVLHFFKHQHIAYIFIPFNCIRFVSFSKFQILFHIFRYIFRYLFYYFSNTFVKYLFEFFFIFFRYFFRYFFTYFVSYLILSEDDNA